MNKNYVSGRRFEYKVMDFFKKIGAKVLRNAGSHKPDIAIFFPKKIGGENWIVECKKNGILTKGDRQELKEFMDFKVDGIYVAYPFAGMIALRENE